MSERRVQDALIWFAASALGVFFARRMISAALVDGQYTPVGNDSFYHARRILDAAVGDRGFYQFDNMIHVPEGSWLTWPWAYDYLLAKGLAIALWVSPGAEPMAILSYVPLMFLVANTGLLVLIAREMNLHAGLTLVALLAFAAFPLNQFAYGVGVLDHHSIEQSFVLMSLLLGMKYFRQPDSRGRASTLGGVLGIAPAFHNGLFILQIPVLVCVLILWLRNDTPPRKSLLSLAGAIVVYTSLILLPSAPIRDLQFEYSTLSWFHLYTAISTAIMLAAFGWRPCSKRILGMIALLALALVAPLLFKIMNATDYLAGDLLLLKEIAEVKSPLRLMLEPNGTFIMSSNYSWLILAAPVITMAFAWRMFHESRAPELFLAVSAVFGLTLLLMQVRLHVFGSWALFLGGVWLIGYMASQTPIRLSVLASVVALIVGLAYYPALRYQLFKEYPPGLTNEYATTRALYPVLAAACEAEPGTVLAYHDDGHRIRYHTDCSVIANNFLLTEEHGAKIMELQALLRVSPEELLDIAPQLKYIFARLYNVMRPGASGFQPATEEEVVAANEPLFVALTMRDDLPDEFRLLAEIRFGDDRDYAYARIFRIRQANGLSE